MAVTTARQKVLAYFKKQHVASAGQIGRALNMSTATVRHHLSVMAADGRIELLEESRNGGRGRPIKLYKLSEKLLGDNLALITDSVLQEWLKSLSPAKREDALQRIAKALVNQIGASQPEIPIAKRLAIVIEKLNAFHYQARWEAGAQGPRLLFRHCPYAAIINRHPELCQIDAAIISTMSDMPAKQVSKINVNSAQVCVFLLSEFPKSNFTKPESLVQHK